MFQVQPTTLQSFSRIYFLSDLTPAAQNFLNTLKLSFETPVIFSTYDRSLKFNDDDLIIFEVPAGEVKNSTKIIDELQIRLNDAHVALFIEPETDISQLIKRFIVKGVFTKEMSNGLVQQGIEKIDQGSFWFSREQFEIITQMRKGADLTQLSREFELTIREKQILHYLVNGYSINQMAEKLFIAENTIKTHRNRLYKKMGVSSGIEAIHLFHKQTSNSVL